MSKLIHLQGLAPKSRSKKKKMVILASFLKKKKKKKANFKIAFLFTAPIFLKILMLFYF